MRFALISLAMAMLAGPASASSYTARIEVDGSRKQLVHKEATHCHVADGEVRRMQFPRDVAEHQAVSKVMIVEFCASSLAAMDEALAKEGVDTKLAELKETRDEVVTLVQSGPSENRIDLVFMGDGYTEAERDLFFDDMRRLVNDMFAGNTFRSQLPLFNIHLVFRASDESGIGRRLPKDTAYGLYREGDTLRAIYMSNQSAARASCRAAPGCDYPVVIGNDPHYGGLGGEFAISTSSVTNGTVVLRHELGHTIGRVGEEYDGGGYFGANWDSSWRDPKWSHWLTPEEASAEPIIAHHLAWPWKFLPDGSYRASWESQEDYAAYSIHFSASGIQSDDAIKLTLDDEQLPFTAPGHLDRDFHDIFDYEAGFGAGNHELVVSDGPVSGDHWLSNITIFEFGEGFHFEHGYINSYPVFTRPGSVAGYRPTFDACLMREMTVDTFCKVCTENNWLQMLSRISMIDDLTTAAGDDGLVATVKTLSLGQFASPGSEPREDFFAIRWSLDGNELSQYDDQAEIVLPAGTSGSLKVDVQYVTPEVRLDAYGYLQSDKTVRL